MCLQKARKIRRIDMVEKISDFIPIKKSHITFYNNKFPLYYLSKDGEPVLFKEPGKKLTKDIFDGNQHSNFFIRKKDEAFVVKTLMSVLNMKLAKTISSKGIIATKQAICQILKEALEGPFEISLQALPETIEILFFNGKKTPAFFEALTSVNNNSPTIIEHSVNVLAITAQYCFFKKYSDDEMIKFGLCALLHDAGTAHIDRKIIETNETLTEEEFEELKTHTKRGYKELKSSPGLDNAIAMVALQHHELLDGSGYPDGSKNFSFESQVVGLIDSYEPLKYRDKSFRKALQPYDALQIIKKDVVQGRYNKEVFIDLCSCLINKSIHISGNGL